jgi:hypothetical protein
MGVDVIRRINSAGATMKNKLSKTRPDSNSLLPRANSQSKSEIKKSKESTGSLTTHKNSETPTDFSQTLKVNSKPPSTSILQSEMSAISADKLVKDSSASPAKTSGSRRKPLPEAKQDENMEPPFKSKRLPSLPAGKSHL